MSAAARVVLTDQPSLRYDDNPDFNQYLDDEQPAIEIAGSVFRPSRILFEMEPDTYVIALNDFRRDQAENLRDIVFTSFPTPVAYYFYRFEKGYENNLQRLHWLRDTWESLISSLYAVVLGDFRTINAAQPICTQIKRKRVLSDKLHDRLEVIRALIEAGSAAGWDLPSLSLFTLDAIDRIAQLNRRRNGFSHSAAQSEMQAKQIISETYEEVLAVLQAVENLKDVEFFRYVGTGESALLIRCERHCGYHQVMTIQDMRLPPDQIAISYQHLDARHVLARIDNKVFNVEPLIHFAQDQSGHSTKLCLLKKQIGGQQSRTFLFEVVGESRQMEVDVSVYGSEIDQLLSMFGDDGQS